MSGGAPVRAFLVGCPRSGTTLLQALLAAHPRVASFPESHFFARLLPRGGRRDPGRVSGRAAGTLRAFLAALGRSDLEGHVPRAGAPPEAFVRAFVGLLDLLARERGRDRWVEKTPRHLHFVDLIEGHVPDARVLHVVRGGADVVASLYEVTNRYPERWGGARDLESCVARWNRDLRATLACAGRPGHLLVGYERLVEDPEGTLEGVCAFLDVAFDGAMLRGQAAAFRALVGPDEPWKARAGAAVSAAPRKFERVLDEAQRAYVLRNLEPLTGGLADGLLPGRGPSP